jgi:hypothetical protein
MQFIFQFFDVVVKKLKYVTFCDFQKKRLILTNKNYNQFTIVNFFVTPTLFIIIIICNGSYSYSKAIPHACWDSCYRKEV